MSKSFRFKQFTVHQDKVAMKVGTDGVLLGAWVAIDKPQSILDIGTGTGLIALMLAQRSDAEQIDALEIDDEAYEQAVDNFENSAWADRLFCYHASYQEFTAEIDETYDLIVSNPPFYTEDYSSSDKKRDLARMNDSLPFEELINSSVRLLNERGKLAMIIPYKEENRLLKLALEYGLFPQKITRVKGTPHTEIKRSLLLFSFKENQVETDELVIEIARHHYTPEFTALVQDFYLKL